MKRNHYQISGDTVVGLGYLKSPKVLAKHNPKLDNTSYFSGLPGDVILLILGEVAYFGAQDLQNLMRYVLLVFGVSLEQHLEKYPEWQTEILSGCKKLLDIRYPVLFKDCRNDRLDRINRCSDVPHSNHYNGYAAKYEDRISSLIAILNADYLELFAFTNHHLCECCGGAQFANVHYAIGEETPLVYATGERRPHIPLCAKCDDGKVDNTFTEAIVDCWGLQKIPILQYRWLSEAKLRKFCSLKKNADIAAYLEEHDTTVRIKRFVIRNVSKPFYLLKDALPLILPKFKREGEPVFMCGTC